VKVLVTGGAGYIGSTVCSALEQRSLQPVIVDSLIQGRPEFVEGRVFYQGDIADPQLIRQIMADHPDIQAVIHLAALIVVPESVADPLRYYTANVVKAISLFSTLTECGLKRFIFSSSASIYDTDGDLAESSENVIYRPGLDAGRRAAVGVTEESPIKPASPYARTKSMVEQVLEDHCQASGVCGLALRYFNPIGADPKMRSGPYIHNPSHVLGRMLESARGRSGVFLVTGTDYPTRDGTGLRDYIHVWDLALAHVAAVEQFDPIFSDPVQSSQETSYLAINLGSGEGVTVRELMSAFEAASGLPLPTRDAARRPGDSAGAYAVIERARRLLNWSPTLTTEQAIRHALQWDEIRTSRFADVELERQS
jgi:UDP-glucose 4-epimerase